MPDRSVSLVISVRVLPGRRAGFLTGISRNAVASVRDEPGCLRFDVAADTEDPDLFWVYEVFADREALEAHRRTPHFLSWQAEKAGLVVPDSQTDRLGSLLVSEE
ncbi:putative quinol monooxygenase [Nocardiopsis aegyptia]|uniref:Quinol monooxygenase YgiN n=1 Tax=Nocardiopsis aegyptia TaxID=220378 RepID=A0A7Z0J9X9_9ACTN|nr:putative quinol monooxygenase [Nocardiopsis aegyptia]NYJ34713.1 quinol monooxygenase YgiN [Nocardiopsis aegyptia]